MTRPTRILVLRHGQSTWNAANRWQGQADPPLTALGEVQAVQAAAVLAESGPATFAEVVASDLQRAALTATLIAAELGHGPVALDRRLRERHAGAWQGLTMDEVQAGWPGYLEHGLRPPGFEAARAAGRRAIDALRAIAARVGPDVDVLAVSHGGILRSVRRVLGEPGDHGFANLSGQWFEVSDTGLRGAQLVSLASGERPAARNPL